MVLGRDIDNVFVIWWHGEESLRDFLEQVNMFHATIKLTSKEKGNYLEVNVKSLELELKTDLLTKPTDIHQLLD